MWRHPTAFDSYPIGLEQGMNEGKVGEPFYFSVTQGWEGKPRVHLREASPHVTTNSARAGVEVVYCQLKPDQGTDVVGNADEATAAQMCDFKPLDGAELREGAPRMGQLLVKVTAHQPGAVEVRGVDIAYSQGWQSGRQRTGDKVTLTAR